MEQSAYLKENAFRPEGAGFVELLDGLMIAQIVQVWLGDPRACADIYNFARISAQMARATRDATRDLREECENEGELFYKGEPGERLEWSITLDGIRMLHRAGGQSACVWTKVVYVPIRMRQGIINVRTEYIARLGRREWWVYGLRHRADGAAIVDPDGTREWFHLGQRHRALPNPAVIRADGTCQYWVNGKRVQPPSAR